MSIHQAGSLMPRACGGVKHPRSPCRGERQDVELVALLLVGVGHGVGDHAVVLDGELDGVGRDALAAVANGAVDNAAAARVGAQPEQGVVELGHRIDGGAAQFVKRALDALQREVRRTGVVPDLDGAGAKQPRLAVVDVDRDELVRGAFGAGEVERVDAGAVQQARHPHLLRARLIEDEIAIEIADRRGAGEVGVANRRERARGHIVDVAIRIGGDEDLRAVVGYRHRPGAVNRAQKRGVVGGVDLVEAVARHDVAVRAGDLGGPQPPDRAVADGGQLAQPWRAIKERRLLAAFRHDLRVEVYATVIRCVDAAGDVRGA